jgi:hypothetical protein
VKITLLVELRDLVAYQGVREDYLPHMPAALSWSSSSSPCPSCASKQGHRRPQLIHRMIRVAAVLMTGGHLVASGARFGSHETAGTVTSADGRTTTTASGMNQACDGEQVAGCERGRLPLDEPPGYVTASAIRGSKAAVRGQNSCSGKAAASH